MPINPSIALGVKGPLDIQAQYAQLKAAEQESQLRDAQIADTRQQIQQRDMANQKAARLERDAQTFQTSLRTNKGDIEKTLKESQGVIAPEVYKAYSDNYLETRKKLAETNKAELDASTEKTKLLGGALQGVIEQVTKNPENGPNAFSQARAHAIANGWAKPEEIPDAFPGLDWLQQHSMLGEVATHIHEAAQKDQKAAQEAGAATDTHLAAGDTHLKSVAELPGVTAKAATEVAEAPVKAAVAAATMKDPLLLDPKERQAATQAAATLANTKDSQKAANAIAQGHLAVDRSRLKMQQEQAGFEQGGGVSAVAKAIAGGDLDALATRAAFRKNPGLIAQVKAIDPEFNELNIDKRQDVLKEFTSSSNTKAGGQVTALNTLIHHAELYRETAEALKNGTFKPGNALYNKVAATFGAAPPIQSDLVARFFAAETGKVATGGVPAEGEINGILKNLGNDGSPLAMAGAADSLLQIAAGKMIPLQEKVDDAKLGKLVRIIGPDAEAILTRNGYDPKTMKKVGAGGAVHVGQTVKLKGGKTGKITAVHPDGSFDIE